MTSLKYRAKMWLEIISLKRRISKLEKEVAEFRKSMAKINVEELKKEYEELHNPFFQFRVGDKVRIREWDDMAEEYGVDEDGDIDFSEDSSFSEGVFKAMKRFCGKEAKVAGVDVNDCGYLLDISGGEWYWPAEALISAEK